MKFNFGNFGGFQQDPESGEYSWTPPNRQNSRPKKAPQGHVRGQVGGAEHSHHPHLRLSVLLL